MTVTVPAVAPSTARCNSATESRNGAEGGSRCDPVSHEENPQQSLPTPPRSGGAVQVLQAWHRCLVSGKRSLSQVCVEALSNSRRHGEWESG